jgi:hypothetical protein
MAPSSTRADEPYSVCPGLSDGRQGSSPEISKDKINIPEGMKVEREVTKDSTGTRENEVHDASLLFCPVLTCNRHNGKGFTRQENLNEHMRRRHREHCNTPELDRKRKVEADKKESFEEIKRLRQETRDLTSQFTALDVRSREMMALMQQLQENTPGAG